MTKSNTSNGSLPDHSTLELISKNHESKGDRLVQVIKSRKSPKGQLRIQSFFGGIALAALFFSLPHLFGVNNIWGYWTLMAYLFFLAAPMVGFIAAMIAKARGFQPIHQFRIGVAFGFIVSFPVLYGLLLWNWNQPSHWMIGWSLQLGAVYIAMMIFKD